MAASNLKCNTPFRIKASMSKRTYEQIKESERHAIALGLQQKQSIRAIARALGRSPSTISREIHRNAGGNGYASRFAHQRSCKRRIHSRPQPKLHRQGALYRLVCDHLHLHWSPQQIAGHLKKLHPHDRRARVSHESIYTCIYAHPRGELRKELVSCLRMAHAKRWPRSKGKDRRGEIQDLLSIHVRPPEIEDRQLPGHWEGDLIKGANNASAIGTLVERTTRLVLLVKLPHPNPATAAHVLQAFSDKLNKSIASANNVDPAQRGWTGVAGLRMLNDKYTVEHVSRSPSGANFASGYHDYKLLNFNPQDTTIQVGKWNADYLRGSLDHVMLMYKAPAK